LLSAGLLVHVSTLMLRAHSNCSKYFPDPISTHNSSTTYWLVHLDCYHQNLQH